MSKRAEIWFDGKMVGATVLSAEEALHFSCAPRVAAKCALSSAEITLFGLDDDDLVTVCVNE